MELLEATVRAGHTIEKSNFLIQAQNGVKAQLICHYLQGHTHRINRKAASLLASQLLLDGFDHYEGNFGLQSTITIR